MNIGITIKKLRNRMGMTQVVFANKAGITQTYLSQIESGAKIPNLSTLSEIATTLSIPVEVLIYFSLDVDSIDPKKRELFINVNESFKSILADVFLSEKI